MKLRIYYDGYDDLYKVQKSWLGIFWKTLIVDAWFDTTAEFRELIYATKYLETKIQHILLDRKDKEKRIKKHLIANERAKNSCVVCVKKV